MRLCESACDPVSRAFQSMRPKGVLLPQTNDLANLDSTTSSLSARIRCHSEATAKGNRGTFAEGQRETARNIAKQELNKSCLPFSRSIRGWTISAGWGIATSSSYELIGFQRGQCAFVDTSDPVIVTCARPEGASLMMTSATEQSDISPHIPGKISENPHSQK